MIRWLLILLLCISFGAVTAALAQDTLSMPVPLRTIYPGQNVDAVDIGKKLFTVPDVSRSTYVLQNEQLAGKEAVRTLAAGKPIPLSFVRTKEDVKKGQPTKAIYNSGTIEIQGMLMPLTGGTVGQVVQARNAASGHTVNALVLDGGTLLVVGK